MIILSGLHSTLDNIELKLYEFTQHQLTRNQQNQSLTDPPPIKSRIQIELADPRNTLDWQIFAKYQVQIQLPIF